MRTGRRVFQGLTFLGLLATVGVAQEAPFPLTKAVPADVFLVTAERHNPERDFLDAYWGEVWQAFRDSGVLTDVTALVLGQIPEEGRREVTRVCDRFRETCADVDWKALGDGEIVFAERLQAPVFVKKGVVLTQPDMVFLFRVDSGVAAETFAAFRGVLMAAAEEAQALVGCPLEVDELVQHDTKIVSLDLLQCFEDAPSVMISVGLREDVVFATYGQGIREEVVELLAGRGESKSIAANPRFVKALDSLPPSAEALEFVEFHNLRRGIDRFTARIFAMAEAEIDVEEQMLNAVREGEVYALTRRALIPYRAGRYDEALELTLEAHRMAPTDTIAMFNLACLYALKGEKERALDWLDKTVAGGFHAPTAIATDPDLTSLREEPRYAEILGRAMLAARADSLAPLATARQLVDRALLALEVLDYSATSKLTRAYATHGQSVTALAHGAQRSPFGRVFANRADLTDFMRFLPRETTSFDVSAGIDVLALYEFIEDSVAGAGPPGQEALMAWKWLQERYGFDVRADVLGWIDGATVQASFLVDGEDAWVWRLKVRDDQVVREKLELVLEDLPVRMAELTQKQPMLAMLTPRTSPTAHEELQGFHDVAVGMMVHPIVCGVRDGWLVVGSSAEAVALAEAAAAGRYPTVAENEELMRKAVLPDGPVSSVSFSDLRDDADVAAAIVTGISSFGGMTAASVPDPEVRELLTGLFGILAKLPPVISKIDFYEYSAHATIFDGEAWHTRCVTEFVPPERRGAPTPAEN